jgi:hypothetical protein
MSLPREVAQRAIPAGLGSDLIATLRDTRPRAAMALAAAKLAWPAVSHLREKARERATYTVRVTSTDDIFDDLHEWVLGLLPAGEQRALVAWSSRRPCMNGEAVSVPGSPARRQAPVLRLRYDGTREQEISVGAHAVRVVVSEITRREEGPGWKPPEITFTAASAAGRDALLGEMRQVLARSHAGRQRPVFRMLDQWGDWTRLDDLPARTPASVILPPGQMERIIADVGQFLASEADYARRCIPWHRGHLYEGPPGTGKTSVARAVAAHFGLDVWYLPLADVKKDGTLLRTITSIGSRSVLLLEDIDVVHAARERDDDNGLTLSGVLNALDGMATPHGLLTILTTNTPEVLDEALVRPGRIDLTEHFGLAGEQMTARLISRYYDAPLASAGGVPPVSPAGVVEACKQSTDPAGALARLRAGSVHAALRSGFDPADDLPECRDDALAVLRTPGLRAHTDCGPHAGVGADENDDVGSVRVLLGEADGHLGHRILLHDPGRARWPANTMTPPESPVARARPARKCS